MILAMTGTILYVVGCPLERPDEIINEVSSGFAKSVGRKCFLNVRPWPSGRRPCENAVIFSV